MTKTTNATSQEYQLLVLEYKANLLKYQPGPDWYFGWIESGIDYEGNVITVEEMKRKVARVSPIGPPVPGELIKNITPAWDAFENYDAYQTWIASQTDAFYYSRSKEDFSVFEAYRIASQLGYSKLIMENLS